MSLFYSVEQPVVEPADNLTIPQFLFDTRHPARPEVNDSFVAFIQDDTGDRVTLRDLKTRSIALAKSLKEHWNIGDQDVVGISSPSHIEYPVITWAVLLLGGVVATMSPSGAVSEHEHQIKLVKPKIVFAHSITLDTVEKAIAGSGLSPTPIIVKVDGRKTDPAFAHVSTVCELINFGSHLRSSLPSLKLAPGEARRRPAFLCFSSGTTGTPKAVIISHYNIISNIVQTAGHWHVNKNYAPWEERRFRPGDVCLGVVPFYHIYGALVMMHIMLFSAITVVIMPQFNFEKMLQDIQNYKITHLFIVPPQATLLCKHPATKRYDLSSIRFCMVAAAPVSVELTSQLLEILPNVHLGQAYGMTETTGGVTSFPVSQKVGTLGGSGTLYPGTVAKIVKVDGTLAKCGEPGELWVKGSQVVLGYYQNEQATQETFVGGWIRTGDEGYFAENGELFIVDRVKELIKVKGLQVSPAELEGHLILHPDVSDVVVVGRPDEYAGELPIAFVVPSTDAASRIVKNAEEWKALETNIKKHVSEAKSRYKWLDRVYFVEAIPKNPSGKILRRVLREQLRNTKLDFTHTALARL